MSGPSSADLLRDHAAIESLSARLARLIETDAQPSALALALDHLVATVADHLAVEDAMIYTLAMQARSGAAADDAERMRAAFDTLKADWAGYLTLWDAEAIAADRAGFVSASQAMLPRLRDRVHLENALLFHASMQRGQASAGGA